MSRRIIIILLLGVLGCPTATKPSVHSTKSTPKLIPQKITPELPKATITADCPWYILTTPLKPGAVCAAVSKQAQWEEPFKCDEDVSPILTMPQHKTRAMRFVVHKTYPKETTYLAIEHRERWYVRELQTEHDIGISGISESVTIPKMRFEQRIQGDLPELVIVHQKEHNDSDMNLNEYEYLYEHHLLVVGFQRPQPTIVLEMETYKATGRDLLVDDEEANKGIKHSPNVPRKKETGIKVTFAPNKSQYTVAKRGDIKPNHKLGTFELKAPNTQCAWPKSTN